MIEQFRVGSGKHLLEFPAGMVDSKNIINNAVREVKEELNISIKKKSLKKLGTKMKQNQLKKISVIFNLTDNYTAINERIMKMFRIQL